jgi:hypothetical protein
MSPGSIRRRRVNVFLTRRTSCSTAWGCTECPSTGSSKSRRPGGDIARGVRQQRRACRGVPAGPSHPVAVRDRACIPRLPHRERLVGVFEIQPAELEVNRSRFTSTQVEVDRTVFLPGCPAELPVCRTSAPISIRWPVVAAAPRKPPSKSLGCSRCNVCRRTAMVFGVLQLPPPRLRVCRGSTPPTMAKPTGCAGESQPGTAPVSVGAAAR